MAETSAILVCGVDPAVRKLLEFSLCMDGHQVSTAENPEEALELLRTFRFDLFLCDVGPADKAASDLLRRLRLTHPDLAVGALTDSVDAGLPNPALFDFLISKPVGLVELSREVARVTGEESGALTNSAPAIG